MHSLLYLFHFQVGSLKLIKAMRFRPAGTPGMGSNRTNKPHNATPKRACTVKGGVGAAVVLCGRCRGIKTLNYHLGPSSEHTVLYEAEIDGMVLGLQFLHNETTPIRHAPIALNHQ